LDTLGQPEQKGATPMSEAPADFNSQIIAEFRANHGHVGGRFEGATLLLLHTQGARSGTRYTNPVVYLADGGRYVVFASKAGAPSNPGWYHNLKAHPDVSIEVGDRTIEVTANELTGTERDRLFARQVEIAPGFAAYQAKTERVIPVVALTPKER
jgi:deazaflavin-dependent oxidoreductase (nitroreductase family)